MPLENDIGVSFVVPVYNGEVWLERTLGAVYSQADGRPMEVLAVEDGSRDGSAGILERHAADGRLLLVRGERRGAAAAANLGIRRARYPIICQVDQDVELRPGWMHALLSELEAPRVAAAQGYYETDPAGGILSRVMGYDLELRYAAIRTRRVDHVCTGNTAYRASALREVGLIDETLGYGYDNDLAYRLGEAGHELAFVREARSVHRWREGLAAYLAQQYGVGYGRLDLVDKHRGRRVRGDDVSGLRMILHVPVMLLGALALALAGAFAALGGPWAIALALCGGCLGALLVDRTVAGLQAFVRFRDPACLAFPAIHLLRDGAWLAALLVWSGRRLRGKPRRPRDSMLRP